MHISIEMFVLILVYDGIVLCNEMDLVEPVEQMVNTRCRLGVI